MMPRSARLISSSASFTVICQAGANPGDFSNMISMAFWYTWTWRSSWRPGFWLSTCTMLRRLSRSWRILSNSALRRSFSAESISSLVCRCSRSLRMPPFRSLTLSRPRTQRTSAMNRPMSRPRRKGLAKMPDIQLVSSMGAPQRKGMSKGKRARMAGVRHRCGSNAVVYLNYRGSSRKTTARRRAVRVSRFCPQPLRWKPLRAGQR